MKVNRFFLFGLLALFSLVLMACSPAVPLAQTTVPADPLSVILVIAVGFASLAGVSSLVAVLVQIGKLMKLVKDDTAHIWAASLNLLAFCVLIYFGVFQPQLALSMLDGYAAQIAEVALFVLGFMIQITGSKPAYNALKASRIPLLNTSNSRS